MLDAVYTERDEQVEARFSRPYRRGGLFRPFDVSATKKGRGRPSNAPYVELVEKVSTGTEIGLKATSQAELDGGLVALRRAARERGVELRFDGSEVRAEQVEVCPPRLSCHLGVRREWWAYVVVYAKNTFWRGTRSEIGAAASAVWKKVKHSPAAQHIASVALWFGADLAGAIGDAGAIDTFTYLSALFAA